MPLQAIYGHFKVQVEGLKDIILGYFCPKNCIMMCILSASANFSNKVLNLRHLELQIKIELK